MVWCMVRTAANSPRARALGNALKDARESAKLTIRQVGAELGRDHSMISRWENGRIVPDIDDTAAVLEILNVTGQERDLVLGLARDAANQNWVATGLSRRFAALKEWERLADTIINVQPLNIPGLLQTPDYARSIMMSDGATRGEADASVMYRLARQEVLTRNKPVNYIAVIGELAIKYLPCDRKVAIDQLRHLLRVGNQESVTIQALSLSKGYTPALAGPFVLIEPADAAAPIVHLEHYRSSATLTDARDVRDYRLAADQVRRDAMSPDTTTELIAQTITDMESTT
jgi:transcriptional regulator with XRE-family HTH domain